MSHIHSPQPVSGSASASNADRSSGASKSDHAMYSAMLALLSGIGTNESISGSMATLSETLYDTMVKNGTEQIQNLQNELEDSNFVEENWSAFQSYLGYQQQLTQWNTQYAQYQDDYNKAEQELQVNPYNQTAQAAAYEAQYEMQQMKQHVPVAPPIPPCSAADLTKYLAIVSQYGTIDNFRAEQNSIAQQINVLNTDVQNNKAIPDAMQSEVVQLTNAQSEFNSEITSFIRLSQDQLRSIGR